MTQTRKPRKTPESASGKVEGMGRPTLLNAEREATLINAIRLGTPLQTAAKFAGVNDSTVRTWRIKGEQALLKDKNRRNPTERKYADFVTKLDEAIAEPAVRAQRVIHTIMTMQLDENTPVEKLREILKTAQFYLTHRDPKNYSTRSQTELTGADGGPIEVIEADAKKAWAMMEDIFSRSNDAA